MPTVRITERIAAPFASSRVDREAGIIYGALICGPESANGRDCPVSLWPGAIRKYEGLEVNADHSRNPSVDRKIGWVANARVEDGKPRGDIHLLKSHPLVPPILEAAERNPKLFGFSHVVTARIKRIGGREVVEAIEAAESLDLVSRPATTKGVYEGTMTTTLRKLLEGAESKLDGDRRKRVRRLLVEADDDGLMNDVIDAPVEEPAPELSGEDAIDGGIRSLAMAILDDDSLATDEKLKKLRVVFQTKDKLNGTEKKSSDKPDDSESDKPPAEESKQLKAEVDRLIRENAVLKLIPAGVKLTEAQTKALTRADDDAERKALLESWQPRPGEKPTAVGRMSAAELLGKSGKKVEEAKITDAKTFAASIRN